MRIIISWTQRLASLMNPAETIEHLDKNSNDSIACAIKSQRNNRFYTILCFAGTAKFQMMTCRNGLCKQAEHVGFVLRVAGWSSSKAISLSFGSPEIPFAFHRSDFTKAATNRSSEITSDRGQEKLCATRNLTTSLVDFRSSTVNVNNPRLVSRPIKCWLRSLASNIMQKSFNNRVSCQPPEVYLGKVVQAFKLPFWQ